LETSFVKVGGNMTRCHLGLGRGSAASSRKRVSTGPPLGEISHLSGGFDSVSERMLVSRNRYEHVVRDFR
jgi:hypothetical protein